MILPGSDGIDCRHFNGYKPCFPGVDCTESCQSPDRMGTRILIVNLDAMGDVLMTTAQLPAIKRVYPESHITWMTLPNAAPLLRDNPFIDRVMTWSDEQRMILRAETFDLVMNADKSIAACAFVKELSSKEVRGFTLSSRGQIIPANPEAEYNYRLGLDDRLKFRINQRTGQDILAETWKLPYERDEYILHLTDDALAFCEAMRLQWKLHGKTVVGFNTGCSELFPNKKMTVEQHVELITKLAADDDLVFLLLGGREDTERNDAIHAMLALPGNRVVATPTTEGLRRGICYENLADVVITGDSFGMHLAIALRKHVLAWFGLSCWTEIDLYERGEKFFQPNLDCSPCWKRECPYDLECISGIDLDRIADAVREFTERQHHFVKAV